jgi:hypothetical protein
MAISFPQMLAAGRPGLSSAEGAVALLVSLKVDAGLGQKRCRLGRWLLGQARMNAKLPLRAADPNRRSSTGLALQLPFPKVSESMGNHDSKIVDAGGVD